MLITVAIENDPRIDNLEAVRCAENVAKALGQKGMSPEILYVKPDDFVRPGEYLYESIRAKNPECVFNLFEGFSGDSLKEIDFADILEKSRVPFTGNKKNALKACLNKHESKKILKDAGIPVPHGWLVRDTSDVEKIKFNGPLFVKPCFEDGSVGIDEFSLVIDEDSLKKSIAKKLIDHPKGLVIEEFIPGREINSAYLGNFPYEMVGASVLDYSLYPDRSQFLSFNAKWNKRTNDYKELMPVVLGEESADFKNKIFGVCRKAAKALGCSGYFRIDLREKDGELFVIDVNPNPDISPDSGFVRQAHARGKEYADLMEMIVMEAINGDSGK